MANTHSQIKRNRTNFKKNKYNSRIKSKCKTFTSNVIKSTNASNLDLAKEYLNLAFKAIDKAQKQGVFKKNTANRKKSTINRYYNSGIHQREKDKFSSSNKDVDSNTNTKKNNYSNKYSSDGSSHRRDQQNLIRSKRKGDNKLSFVKKTDTKNKNNKKTNFPTKNNAEKQNNPIDDQSLDSKNREKNIDIKKPVKQKETEEKMKKKKSEKVTKTVENSTEKSKEGPKKSQEEKV